MAKEYGVCVICGVVVANTESHNDYHAYLRDTIAAMAQQLTVVWDDAKLDKSKKLDPPRPPDTKDY